MGGMAWIDLEKKIARLEREQVETERLIQDLARLQKKRLQDYLAP